MEAYIKAQLEAFNHQNIESVWRGASLFLFNRQKVLRTITRETTL